MLLMLNKPQLKNNNQIMFLENCQVNFNYKPFFIPLKITNLN